MCYYGLQTDEFTWTLITNKSDAGLCIYVRTLLQLWLSSDYLIKIDFAVQHLKRKTFLSDIWRAAAADGIDLLQD